ncbi:MAG: serine/threonine-protein kinase [Anaerolineae bacterium]|nr:serine/threonine-protein kinase [Anaerolineae bacterium]
MTSGLAGKKLANRYVLDTEVRAEGVGTIYAATDLRHDSTEVLAKVIDVAACNDQAVQRFERSADILKALRRQPWAARLIEHGGDGSHKYLILEMMRGETLAQYLHDHQRLSLDDTLTTALDILAILEHLHALGLMHGDIRPSNIFLEAEPKRVRLLGFDRTLPTNPGQLRKVGFSDPNLPSAPEAPYWSPERLRQPVDARYDIYGLAIVIYEMLSGKRLDVLPTKDPTFKPINFINADSAIDASLRNFLARALHPEISKQFQSAPEMGLALNKFAQPKTLVPAKLSEPAAKPRSQTRSTLHPNDVQLVRVYPREEGGTILEETFPSDAAFEVVVEAKAGAAIFGGGGPYSIHIVVRDLTDFTVVYEGSKEGKLFYEPWHEPVLSYPFTIPAPGPTKDNHIFEALASLRVGLKTPNISFARSPVFIVYDP